MKLVSLDPATVIINLLRHAVNCDRAHLAMGWQDLIHYVQVELFPCNHAFSHQIQPREEAASEVGECDDSRQEELGKQERGCNRGLFDPKGPIIIITN